MTLSSSRQSVIRAWPLLSHDTWLNQYPIITVTSPSPLLCKCQVSHSWLVFLCRSSAPIGQQSETHQPCAISSITSISSIRASQHQSHLHCCCPLTFNHERKINRKLKMTNIFFSWQTEEIMLRRGFLFALKHGWRELRDIGNGNGYVNVGHGTKVILSVSSLSLSGGQELTITTDVFSFPCYQFPFVFTHINKWIQKHTTPFSAHIISAPWTWSP